MILEYSSIELGLSIKFMETLRKYQKQTEQAFGGLRFKTAVPDRQHKLGGGMEKEFRV